MNQRRRHRISHQQRIRLLALMCALPGFLAALLLLLFSAGYSHKAFLTLILLAGGPSLFFIIRLQTNIVHPLQTASNMLAALREGDFSLKAGYTDPSDPLGQLMLEVNLLTEVLAEHRMDAIEAHSFMDKVLQEIDAAVIAFDPQRRLTLINDVAARLLQINRSDLRRRYAAEFNLDKALESPPNATIPHPHPDKPGRFTVRRGTYRVGGKPHELLILIDVSRTLREEELLAWKRLIRVLGHELNNSMAPIRSLAESLQKIAASETLQPEDREDLTGGLEIIRQRADSLSRFIQEYARLAKLPPPKARSLQLSPLVRRIASLYEYPLITIDPENSAEVALQADPDQLEQALLNLIKNAVEAASLTHGTVKVCWRVEGEVLLLHVEDTGPGIANPDNLFIPFFSTKKGGSGIGLTLARQILEGHDGSLELANREDDRGCRASITLPLR